MRAIRSSLTNGFVMIPSGPTTCILSNMTPPDNAVINMTGTDKRILIK